MGATEKRCAGKLWVIKRENSVDLTNDDYVRNHSMPAHCDHYSARAEPCYPLNKESRRLKCKKPLSGLLLCGDALESEGEIQLCHRTPGSVVTLHASEVQMHFVERGDPETGGHHIGVVRLVCHPRVNDRDVVLVVRRLIAFVNTPTQTTTQPLTNSCMNSLMPSPGKLTGSVVKSR